MKDNDLAKHVKDWSPEKRQLMKRLLASKGVKVAVDTTIEPDAGVADYSPPETSAQEPATSAHDVPAPPSGDAAEPWGWTNPAPKSRIRSRYDAYHKKCNSTVFGESSWYMNLGYVANENKQYSTIFIPPHVPNRNSIRLALEVIGDHDLSGRETLDVGCGRGGTIQLIQAHFKPKITVGIDLSPEGISFCNKTHRYPNACFMNGDAENLPFVSASFDVVINIESSHSYPDRRAFYREVQRVLRPGGYFLYSDVLPVDMFRESMAYLKELRFEVERDQDITGNVMISCEQSANLQFDAFSRQEGDEWMANALGLPGSRVYEEMKNGTTNFRITRLRKL